MHNLILQIQVFFSKYYTCSLKAQIFNFSKIIVAQLQIAQMLIPISCTHTYFCNKFRLKAFKAEICFFFGSYKQNLSFKSCFIITILPKVTWTLRNMNLQLGYDNLQVDKISWWLILRAHALLWAENVHINVRNLKVPSQLEESIWKIILACKIEDVCFSSPSVFWKTSKIISLLLKWLKFFNSSSSPREYNVWKCKTQKSSNQTPSN